MTLLKRTYVTAKLWPSNKIWPDVKNGPDRRCMVFPLVTLYQEIYLRHLRQVFTPRSSKLGTSSLSDLASSKFLSL
jgi:hypothetical protein